MSSQKETVKEYIDSNGCRVTVRTTTRSCGGSSWTSSTCPRQMQQSFSNCSPTPTFAVASGQGPSVASEAFRKECLDQHNFYRAKHGVSPLVLSTEINDWAQEWATHLAGVKQFKHRTNNKYGENLYCSMGNPGGITGKEAVDSFYSEIKDYHYYGGEPSMSHIGKFGHFSQTVWKNSKMLGVGVATAGNTVYVVCNYDPQGNIFGNFAANVFPN